MKLHLVGKRVLINLKVGIIHKEVRNDGISKVSKQGNGMQGIVRGLIILRISTPTSNMEKLGMKFNWLVPLKIIAYGHEIMR